MMFKSKPSKTKFLLLSFDCQIQCFFDRAVLSCFSCLRLRKCVSTASRNMTHWNVDQCIDILVHQTISGDNDDAEIILRVCQFIEILQTESTILCSDDFPLVVRLRKEFHTGIEMSSRVGSSYRIVK